MPEHQKSGAKRGPGRPRKFDEESLQVVKQVVIDHPTASMRELVDLVDAATGIRASRPTLRKELRKLGIENVSRPGPKAKRAETPLSSDRASEEQDEKDSSPPRYGYRARHREECPSVRHTLGVSDAEWDLVRDLFEDKTRGVPRKYSRRDMLDAMLYVLRGGIAWRALPSEYPPWHRVYKTYRRWVAQGRFRKGMRRVRRMWREREGRNQEPTGAVLDSQSVATSAQGGPKGYDAGKKIKGRKRHIMTDTLGLLLFAVIHSAGVQDRDGAPDVFRAVRHRFPWLRHVFADGGYAGDKLKAALRGHGDWTIEIIKRSDTAKGFEVLPRRWVVERTFAWLGRCRRLAKDWEQTLESATAWILIASIRLMTRRLARYCHVS